MDKSNVGDESRTKIKKLFENEISRCRDQINIKLLVNIKRIET